MDDDEGGEEKILFFPKKKKNYEKAQKTDRERKNSIWISCVWWEWMGQGANTFIRFGIPMHLKYNTKNKLLGCLSWIEILYVHIRARENFFLSVCQYGFWSVWRCWNKCRVLLFKRNRYCFGRLLPIQFEPKPKKEWGASMEPKKQHTNK